MSDSGARAPRDAVGTAGPLSHGAALISGTGAPGQHARKLARSVYTTNDKRAALKRDINLLCGSAILEEKSYAGS